MTRLTDRVALPTEADVVIDLMLGPTGDHSLEELELAWEAYGAGLREDGVGRCFRVWGWWRFDVGEEKPDGHDAQCIRLAELGLLTAEERSTIAEDAECCREFLRKGGSFYHGSDVGAQCRIDLHEAVEQALERNS